MKKTYGKPDIVYESFQMCNSIAKACEVRVGPTEGQCGLTWGAKTMFAESPTILSGTCTLDLTIDPVTESVTIGNNTLCYHVPIEANNMFTS